MNQRQLVKVKIIHVLISSEAEVIQKKTSKVQRMLVHSFTNNLEAHQ